MKKHTEELEGYRKIPCSKSDLLSDVPFIEASRLLRSIAVDAERYAEARSRMVESRMIQKVPHGFLSTRPYVQLASCISRGRKCGSVFDKALLNIGFWMDKDGKALSSLGDYEFHIVWSPASYLELLRPSYEVFVGTYEHAILSPEQIFSSDLVVSDEISLSPRLEQLLRMK